MNYDRYALVLLVFIFIVSILVFADEVFLKYTDPPYLYDDTETVFFNETYLNGTIDTRIGELSGDTNCSVQGSCPEIAYVDEDETVTGQWTFNAQTSFASTISRTKAGEDYYSTFFGNDYYYLPANNPINVIWSDPVTGEGAGFYLGDTPSTFILNMSMLGGRHRIGSIADPIDDYDAVTKKYLDDSITSLTEVFKPINAINLTGGNWGGDYLSMHNISDGDSYNLSETVGSPAFQVMINYSGVSSFANIQGHVFYDGSPSHIVGVYVKNWITGSYDNFGTISASADFTVYNFAVVDSANYVSSGKVSTVINHTSSGNPSHELYIDYWVLQKTASVTQEHGALTGLEDDDHNQYLPRDGSRNMTGNLTLEDALNIGENVTIYWNGTALRIKVS